MGLIQKGDSFVIDEQDGQLVVNKNVKASVE